MMLRTRSFAIAAAITSAAGCGSGVSKESPAPPSTSPEVHAAAVEAWRAKHEADYRRSFVTIAGLHPLKPGPNTAGSAAKNDIVLPASTPRLVGRFVLLDKDKQVRFEPARRARVLLEGKRLTSSIDLRDDGTSSADELIVGDVRIVVHVSGDSRTIRVRDPDGPLAKGFLGFTWFPIDPQYRVIGRFVRDPQPQKVKVLNTFGDVDEYTTEGIVEFTLLGQSLRLRPFTTRPGRLYFVFRDASSGTETYEAARFLYADLLETGTAVLDFNMAYNPPCAFNPYTTSPIPLRENNLPVKILAGEKAYPIKVPPAGRVKG